MKFLSSPRFANVTALLALVVALGGTGYAAVSLPKNSVSSKQVTNNSLKTKDFRAGQLPAGPPGAPGSGGTFRADPLRSGESVSGVWGTSTPTATIYFAYQQFPIPLAADLDGAHVVYVISASATHCPGVGRADPGYLCVYDGSRLSTTAPQSGAILNPRDESNGSSRYGFVVGLASTATAGNYAYAGGFYTATAP